MSGEYWLADSEARILGPVSLEVIRDLVSGGRLKDVRAISKDGHSFLPPHSFPEAAEALKPRRPEQLVQEHVATTHKLRAWVESIRGAPLHDVLKISPSASKETYRAAFFAMIRRYYPDRLPENTTPEVRRVCEDVFLHLAARMAEFEQAIAQPLPGMAPPRVPPASASAPPPPPLPVRAQAVAPMALQDEPLSAFDIAPPDVTWRGGMLHVVLSVGRRNVSAFTRHPEININDDSVYVTSKEVVVMGAPVTLTFRFESHPSDIITYGRVVRSPAAATGLPAGFGVRLLDLSEADKTFIKNWISRAGK